MLLESVDGSGEEPRADEEEEVRHYDQEHGQRCMVASEQNDSSTTNGYMQLTGSAGKHVDK